jgi:hypothetical protein
LKEFPFQEYRIENGINPGYPDIKNEFDGDYRSRADHMIQCPEYQTMLSMLVARPQ